MKRNAGLWLLILALSPIPVSSLDLGVQTWIGTLGFRSDRTSTDTSFPGQDLFWGVSFYGTQSIGDAIELETGFYSDPVLRNISYTLFRYNEKILSVGVGPFFGFFNDPGTILKSGISTAVKLELPGVMYLAFRSDSSIGGELIEVGNYLQERNDVSLGFYVPNAICALGLKSRKFEQKLAASEVVDSLTEYAFTTEVFQKNVPYRIIVSFAYQSLSKSFIAAATTTTTLNSIVLGTRFDLAFTESFVFQASLEGSVYSFGQGTLVGGASDFLFRAYTGARISVEALPFIAKRL